MGNEWQYTFPSPTTPSIAAQDPPDLTPVDRLLGYGILHPFRRDKKGDVANSGGYPLLRSEVGLVLGTRKSTARTRGEMPWRPEFGSILDTLRHMKMDQFMDSMAHQDVIGSVRRWLPNIEIISAETESVRLRADSRESAFEVRVRFRVITETGRDIVGTIYSEGACDELILRL